MWKPATWRRKNGVSHSGDGTLENGAAESATARPQNGKQPANGEAHGHEDADAETTVAEYLFPDERAVGSPDSRFSSLEEQYEAMYFDKKKNGAQIITFLTRYASAVFQANRAKYGAEGGAEVLRQTVAYFESVKKLNLRGVSVPTMFYQGEPLYVQVGMTVQRQNVTRRRRVLSCNVWEPKGVQVTYENPLDNETHRATSPWQEVQAALMNEYDGETPWKQFTQRLKLRMNPLAQGFVTGSAYAGLGAAAGKAAAVLSSVPSSAAQTAGAALGVAIPLIRSLHHQGKQARGAEGGVESVQQRISRDEWTGMQSSEPLLRKPMELTRAEERGSDRYRRSGLVKGGVLAVAGLAAWVAIGERVTSLASNIHERIMDALGRQRPTAARTVSHTEQAANRDAALPKGIRFSFDVPPAPDLVEDLRARFMPQVQPPEPLMSVTLPERMPTRDMPQLRTLELRPTEAPSSAPAVVAAAPVAQAAAPQPPVAQQAQAVEVDEDTAMPHVDYDGKDRKAHVEGLSDKGNDLVNLFYRLKTQPEHQARKARLLNSVSLESIAKRLSEGGARTLSESVKKELGDEAKPGEAVFLTHALVDMYRGLEGPHSSMSAHLDNSVLFGKLVRKLRAQPSFAEMIPETITTRAQLRAFYQGTEYIADYIERELVFCALSAASQAKVVQAY